VKQPDDDLYHWQKSQDVRAYIAEVRMAAEQQDGGIDLDSRFGKWLAWANGLIRWLTGRLSGWRINRLALNTFTAESGGLDKDGVW
jgi:hypothetical protein